jgi:hypothetical protein
LIIRFQRRADLYADWDRRLAPRTRFFAAAAVTNALLFDLFSGFGVNLWVSQVTATFLMHLGQWLEQINVGFARRIETGLVDSGNLDRQMVAMEQREVQGQLEALKLRDPRGYAITILQINRLMRVAGLNPTPARLLANGTTYCEVLRVVRAQLGRPASFGRCQDRECIGQALIGRMRGGSPRQSSWWDRAPKP